MRVSPGAAAEKHSALWAGGTALPPIILAVSACIHSWAVLTCRLVMKHAGPLSSHKHQHQQSLAHSAHTLRVFKFMRMSNLRLSVMGVYSCNQAVFSGVILF